MSNKYIPSHLILLFKRFLLVLAGMQITRLIFLFSNWNNFQDLVFMDFLAGTWFDLVTCCLLGFPWIVWSALPFSIHYKKWYRWVNTLMFFVLLSIFTALNLIDVEYFSYTQKRSTVDLFTIISAGEDFSQQFSSFVRDFWILAVFFFFIFFVSIWFFKRMKMPQRSSTFIQRMTWFVLIVSIAFVIARGGIRLKPITTIDAAQYTRVENAALILNTPFTLVKSYNQGGLEDKQYFDEQKALALYNTVKKSKPVNLLPQKTNVVIILLESFGNEWVGAAGAEKSFTPFLDSLITQSLYFKNGIANGKKSIEAVPSIISSIPSLLDNPYISSPYGNNQTASLASILKKNGYQTAFFHGATNGSMRFDGFAAQIGFQEYYGRKEYNNDAHFDRTWGILDEYFNPWTAKKLTSFQQPFFATLFTLSSHHPYYIPPHMRGKLKKGPQAICESIHYGDYALKRFFTEAAKQPWYKNTIFVLCADHTSATSSSIYNQRTEMYKIPIVFFDPQKRIQPQQVESVFQHIDIMPTLLDLLNIDEHYYAFGNSYFQHQTGEAITYIEGTYHYFKNDKMLTFSNDKARNLYNISVLTRNTPDSMKYYPKLVKQMEQRVKAIIQRYNHDVMFNKTTVK